MPEWPCVASPDRGLVHKDGPCTCFVGGPAPEWPTKADPHRCETCGTTHPVPSLARDCEERHRREAS